MSIFVETQPAKTYIKVRADHLPDGRIIPLMFRNADDQVVRIDRILDIREAPSRKAGGQGLRYTCRIGRQLVFLFHDHDRWFMED